MPTVIQAIENFLRARAAAHNGPDLVARVTPAMETQVNVAGGEPVEGKRGTFTDGVDEWWNIRIPKQADSEPHFRDYELRWPLDTHVEAIGTTGWDWVNRRSRWVGFDFDAIAGHATGVGLSVEKLEEVKRAACAVPWVEVRKSTGGVGLHLYVLLDVPTANHTEHAALARAVLSLLSSEAGFDFASQVDCCGGVMWIWHRKMTAANGGLALVKASERELAASELPSNWRDHAEVVTRKRAKIRVQGVTNEGEFETLATSRKIVPLDEQHKKLISCLGERAIWIPDYHLLQTHTLGLAELLASQRDELGLVGFFQTASRGSTPLNCFCFPLAGGAWRVYRFTQGVREAATWEQDGQGWTGCYFNRQPDLAGAALALGGTEIEGNKGFQFRTSEQAARAAEALGEGVQLPGVFLGRRAVLRANRDGRLVMDVQAMDGDAEPEGWIVKRGWWTRVFQAQTGGDSEETDASEVVRVVRTTTGEYVGTYHRMKTNRWGDSPSYSYTKAFLADCGYANHEQKIGRAMFEPYELVSLPFQPEYPGGRQWNLNAPQLAFRPADSRDHLEHPHWDIIFEHVGQTLTQPLRELAWAKEAGLRTGGDYLRAWFACVLREPFEPLPYLFLHGPENSGKSILWEAFSLLVTRGVVKADRVLVNHNEFNGELAGALVCAVEERNIAATPGAHNRIKDYVTSRTLSIRRMRTGAYSVPNTTHWIQTANDRDACPVFPGDTRITAIYVPLPTSEIPKAALLEKLTSEAPAFLRTLLELNLPSPVGRLRIAVVETEFKSELLAGLSGVAEFFRDHLVIESGARVAKPAVHERYREWCAANGREPLSNIEFGRELTPLLSDQRPWKVGPVGSRKEAYVHLRFATDENVVVVGHVAQTFAST